MKDENKDLQFIEDAFLGKKMPNGKRDLPGVLNKKAIANMSAKDMEILAAIFNKGKK